MTEHPDFDLAISLGGDCAAAHHLVINNLRHAAYPFDWMGTPFEALYRLVESEFAGFLLPQNLRYRTIDIQDTAFGVLLDHDFPLNASFLNAYDEVKARYDRRISRFREALRGWQRVLFLRFTITRDEAARFAQLLDRQYPNLQYLLAAFGHEPTAGEDWKLPKVKNFRVAPRNAPNWNGDPAEYRPILQSFNVRATEPRVQPLPVTQWIAGAAFHNFTIPSPVRADTTFDLPTDVTNESTAMWVSEHDARNAPIDPVRISYHWRKADGQIHHFDGLRTNLPRSLAPGDSVHHPIRVLSPQQPGDYLLEFDVVVENGGWFSQFGWRGQQTPVRVEA